MARVTTTEVQNIVQTSASGPAIQEHIVVASRLVDDILSGQSLSADRLRDIELYLAAHLTALFDPSTGMATQVRIGEAENEYDFGGSLGEGLKLTRFGQMALTLDTTRRLISAGKTQARFGAYGHNP